MQPVGKTVDQNILKPQDRNVVSLFLHVTQHEVNFNPNLPVAAVYEHMELAQRHFYYFIYTNSGYWATT